MRVRNGYQRAIGYDSNKHLGKGCLPNGQIHKLQPPLKPYTLPGVQRSTPLLNTPLASPQDEQIFQLAQHILPEISAIQEPTRSLSEEPGMTLGFQGSSLARRDPRMALGLRNGRSLAHRISAHIAMETALAALTIRIMRQMRFRVICIGSDSPVQIIVLMEL